MDGGPGEPRDAQGAAPNQAGESASGAEEDGSSSSVLARLLRRAANAIEPRSDADGEPSLESLFAGEGGAGDPRSVAERAMLMNVLKLRDLKIVDVMVPRADIIALSVDSNLDEVKEAFRTASLTRLPVYRETLDDPIGFVHLKDLAFTLGFGEDGGVEAFRLQDHIRRMLFVPPSMPTSALLKRMQATRIHMALVVDEFGGVDGLVTIEDLVEQIVGDIEDEHDEAQEEEVVEERPGVWLCDARVEIPDFEQASGVSLTPEDWEEDVDTLGGLVFMLSNRVPERGEVIAHPEGYEFEIVDADPRRIKRLRVALSGVGAAAGKTAAE